MDPEGVHVSPIGLMQEYIASLKAITTHLAVISVTVNGLLLLLLLSSSLSSSSSSSPLLLLLGREVA